MPQCLQKNRRETLWPHTYSERLSAPDTSANASGFMMPPTAAVLVQIEQLHREPAAASTCTSYRTAPQWQPPTCFFTALLSGVFSCFSLMEGASQTLRTVSVLDTRVARLFVGHLEGGADRLDAIEPAADAERESDDHLVRVARLVKEGAGRPRPRVVALVPRRREVEGDRVVGRERHDARRAVVAEPFDVVVGQAGRVR